MKRSLWHSSRRSLTALSLGVGVIVAAGGALFARNVIALPSGAAHWWTLDDSGSTAADTGTVGGAPGAIGSAVTHLSDGASGGALHFTNSGGGNSAVDFGNPVGQFGTSDFTISLWMRTTATHNQELFGNRMSPSGGNFFGLRTSNGSVIFETDQDASGTNYFPVGSSTADVNAADGQWHHVVARRQGTSVDLFVDNHKYSSPSSATEPTNINNSNDVIAGYSPGVSPYFGTGYTGDLDDIRIYNSALSDTEIVPPPDSDGDGVIDSSDACPGTPAGSIVNASGCSIDQLCPCAGTWKNHGAYTSCVSHTSGDFVDAGLISADDVGAIVSKAAQSACGK